jgi:hypothetical protein
MSKALLLSLTAVTALAADNPWDKVRELKTGTELRVYKKGARQPLLGTMDEANDERLIVVVKNEELAIQKDDIDRIDYRPTKPSGRAAKVTTTTTTDSTQTTPVGPVPQGTHAGPSTTTSTTIGSGSKPDFETIYRRTSVTPEKK